MWRFFLALVIVALFGSACGGEKESPATDMPSSQASTPSKTSPTSTSTPTSVEPFNASVNDFITQMNLQLPILQAEAKPLPIAVGDNGVWGGSVTNSVEMYVQSSGNAFSELLAVTVRVSGASGTVNTPARLLSGVGASLHALSADAVAAFGEDALPQLGSISKTRTTISVGNFYDLTVVVIAPSTLAFVYTPVGVSPAAGAENLGT